MRQHVLLIIFAIRLTIWVIPVCISNFVVGTNKKIENKIIHIYLFHIVMDGLLSLSKVYYFKIAGRKLA